MERVVLAARDLAGFGSQRLKEELGLACSDGSIKRILFAGYPVELNKTYSILLAEYVSARLAWSGVDLHRVVEDEFFDRDPFRSRADFREKVTLYGHDFNISRPNRPKGKKTLLPIITERNPEIHPAIASWRALDPGFLFRQ